VCDPGFTYPPFFALVMLPFVPMPLWLRDLVWYGVTLAAALGAFKLSETIADKSLAAPLARAELFWLRLFVLLLSSKLILAVFENQAYDALVLAAVLVGLFALSEDRPLAAGAGLALAAALKATPLIFLPYLLWKRYYAAAAAFVLVYALASLVPDLLFAPVGGSRLFLGLAWRKWLARRSASIRSARHSRSGTAPISESFAARRGFVERRRSASPQLVRGGLGLRRRLLHGRGRDAASRIAAPAASDRYRRLAVAYCHADALADDEPLALCGSAAALYDAVGTELA